MFGIVRDDNDTSHLLVKQLFDLHYIVKKNLTYYSF